MKILKLFFCLTIVVTLSITNLAFSETKSYSITIVQNGSDGYVIINGVKKPLSALSEKDKKQISRQFNEMKTFQTKVFSYFKNENQLLKAYFDNSDFFNFSPFTINVFDFFNEPDTLKAINNQDNINQDNILEISPNEKVYVINHKKNKKR